MPRLDEYKAKHILKTEGIAVPEGYAVGLFDEMNGEFFKRQEEIVLKSQVPVGGRGKKKGIIIAEKDSAESVFEELINRKIEGILPEKILIEEKIDYSTEYYLSVYSCLKHRCPVLMFSSSGGVDIEVNDDKVLVIPVKINDEEMSERVFREKLTVSGEINENEVNEIAGIFSLMFRIYRKYDCKLVEINPLVKSPDGFIALDAKILIDDDALFRQSEKLGLKFYEEIENRKPTELELLAGKIDEADYRGTAHFVQFPVRDIQKQYGDKIKALIGLNCVGTGVSLTIMDEFARFGYFSRNFADTSGNPPASKVYRMTKIILAQKDIKGYVFATCVSSQQLDNTARGIIKAFKEIFAENNGVPDIPVIFLFRGAWEKEAIDLFKEHNLLNAPNLRILDSRFTEKDTAFEFDKLYKEWSDERKT